MVSVVGVTWNVMMPVPEPIRYTGQMQRAARIPQVLVDQIDPVALVDFVVVQESIVDVQHAVLSEAFHDVGFIHESEQITGSLKDLKLVRGGLVVFSRIPILHQAHCMFEGLCAREDCVAAKGCVYVQLSKDGYLIHLFVCHVQSWESPESRHVRRGQFQEMRRFVEAQHIPANEPVIMMGDWNVDYVSERKQLLALQSLVGFEMLPRHPNSHPFTSDPLTNQLMGIDDVSAYTSDAYPNGCAEEYFRSLHCVCCPQEWLDYALVSRKHLSVDRAQSWMRALPVKAAPFWANLTLAIRREIQDLSDHYPLLAHYHFPDVTVKSGARLTDPPRFPSRGHQLYREARDVTGLMVYALLALISLMTLAYLAWLLKHLLGTTKVVW